MQLNGLILIGPFLVAVFYPHIGNISSILGGFGSYCAIYTLPTLTNITQKRALVENPNQYDEIPEEREDIDKKPLTTQSSMATSFEHSNKQRLNPSSKFESKLQSETSEADSEK
jgi:hypothetical protein